MSVIYYKFKAAKDFSTIKFDGMGISAFDVKRDIMLNKKLGKGLDLDLHIYNAHSNDEYVDDNAIIPRNTQILVKRSPPAGKQGTAQRYVNQPVAVQQSSSRITAPTGPPKSTTLINNNRPQSGNSNTNSSNLTEQDEISNLFKQSDEQWDHQQKSLASHRPVYRPPPNRGGRGGGGSGGGGGGGRGKPQQGDDEPAPYTNYQNTNPNWIARPPPPGYICFRCGKQGHYLNQCPTLGDAEFDKPRLKKTTGIPKMFLKVVNDRSSVDGNVMITQDGSMVVAKPNESAWNQITTRTKNYTIPAADIPDELKCPICKELMKDAVEVPCCKTTFCDECIRHSLLENPDQTMRFRCPSCKADQFADNLTPSGTMRQKIANFIKEYTNAKKEKSPQPPDSRDTKQGGTPTGGSPVLGKKGGSPTVPQQQQQQQQQQKQRRHNQNNRFNPMAGAPFPYALPNMYGFAPMRPAYYGVPPFRPPPVNGNGNAGGKKRERDDDDAIDVSRKR